MNRFLYPKLAATNLKKNASTYFPYILTGSCSVMTFYIVSAISRNKGVDTMPGAASFKTMLSMGTLVVALFSVIFLFYTNSFLIKRRKKELGLYCILGMEKRHIAKVMFYETLYVTLLSVGGGLLAGMLLGKLIFLALLHMLGLATPIAFTISAPAIGSTLSLYGIIYLLTLLTNLRNIHVSNPIDLLHGGKKGEREPKASWLLTVSGLVCLGAGYAISLCIRSPIEAVSWFFVAVILVILGTYALFMSGSVALLKVLKHSKKYYYKPNHFISVSGMIYRMRQNAVGLANICILSTMVLVLISVTVSLYVGKEGMLKQQYQQDISISLPYEEQALEEVSDCLQRVAEENGVTLENQFAYRAGVFYTFVDGNRVGSQVSGGMTTLTKVTLLSLEDYNRIMGEQKSLQDGEALFFTNTANFNRDTIVIGDREYKIKEELDCLFLSEKRVMLPQTSYFVILKDAAAMKEAVQAANTTDASILRYDMIADVAEGKELGLLFSENLEKALGQMKPVSPKVESIFIHRVEWNALYGGFLFVGVFLGVLFLMATALIIYYKQISEGYDDHDRFEIMQKVGMSQKEVKKTIRKQILAVFFLPLAGAVLHVAAAFKILATLLSMFSLWNTGLIVGCMAITVLIFAVVYAIIYSMTAKTYYKLVQQKF